MYFVPIPVFFAHSYSIIEVARASNYRNCETVYSFEVLAIATKNSISHIVGILDVSLVTEKTDLSLRFVLPNC